MPTVPHALKAYLEDMAILIQAIAYVVIAVSYFRSRHRTLTGCYGVSACMMLLVILSR